MSDTTALQNLHKRLSDAKKEPTIVVKVLTQALVNWKQPVSNKPKQNYEIEEKIQVRSFVNWKQPVLKELVEIGEIIMNKPTIRNFVNWKQPIVNEPIQINDIEPTVVIRSKPANWKQSVVSETVENIEPKDIRTEHVKHNTNTLMLKFMSR